MVWIFYKSGIKNILKHRKNNIENKKSIEKAVAQMMLNQNLRDG